MFSFVVLGVIHEEDHTAKSLSHCHVSLFSCFLRTLSLSDLHSLPGSPSREVARVNPSPPFFALARRSTPETRPVRCLEKIRKRRRHINVYILHVGDNINEFVDGKCTDRHTYK